MWLMGGHHGSPHTVLHNEDSFIFNTIECLSHSTLCGGDWLSLCGVSGEAYPPQPHSPLLQTGICSSSCLLQLDKERAGFFLFLFFKTNELMALVWNVGCNGPSAPWMHILAFCYSNTSQQDILRGSRVHVPPVCHCVDNNLLNTKEK